VSTPEGGAGFVARGDLVASNGHLHARILQEMAAVPRGAGS
jgi:hypothetical protein